MTPGVAEPMPNPPGFTGAPVVGIPGNCSVGMGCCGVGFTETPPWAGAPPNWKTGGYLERLPRDPWGNSYQYLNPGVRGEIDVFSFGADGAPGGEGADADIGSWSL